MTKKNQVQVLLAMNKETKGTIRFEEAVGGILDTPKLGTLYVPKSTLKELGFTGTEKIQLTIELA